MKTVRTDFDCDINKILSKRFKIKLNTTSFKITERLPLNDRDIQKIKESYKENLALVNLKKNRNYLNIFSKRKPTKTATKAYKNNNFYNLGND